jgi:hypothetical protein
VGIPNNKYTYQKLIDYVEGMGPYWMKLVDQMIPATTIWNTGIKYENSILHKQKFVYRRQRGCEFVPVPAEPCSIITNIFDYSCALEYVDFFIYPWLNGDVTVSNLSSILNNRLNNYLTSQGLTTTDCILSTLKSTWFVDLRFNDVPVVTESFFNGIGYNTPGLSNPTTTDWDNALVTALDSLSSLGYDYYLTNEDTIIIYGTVCGLDLNDLNFKLNVGINFNILCS